ncbi:uncharacterized protein LOC124819178 isoform X2 [Hydra vulgaris]|uniref:Uncharacterized protein LOC124819178 isoform X2 n=1 Tax=Hydra vulgaris TaxID=6087 RepID=A0ABM4DFL4_HYDVU
MILNLCLIWQFLSVTSFIIRLPCNLHAKFNKIKNAYMNGNVIKSLNNVNSSDCAVACVSNFKCTLVNWKEDEMICELLSETNPQQISKDLWMVLQPENTNNKTIGQICEQVNPCDSTQICRDVCDSTNKHTFSCVSSMDVSRDATPVLSSTYWGYLFAKYAIDGNVNTFAGTDAEDQSWFKLDLHYVYQITQIVIYNRVKCCPERMDGNLLIVSVTDSFLGGTEIATLTSDLVQTFTDLFIGRYVFLVKIPGGNLQLAEINVLV